mgnify:CR=1 FL=1
MEEQRKNNRWQINQGAKINLLEEEPLLLEGVINDITLKGAKITLKEKLPQKPALDLNINIAPGLLINNLKVTVAWRKESEELNTYGLFFNWIDDKKKQEIYDFVYKNSPQEITKHWWAETKPLSKPSER